MGDLIYSVQSRVLNQQLRAALTADYAPADDVQAGTVTGGGRVNVGGQVYPLEGGAALSAGDVVAVHNVQRAADALYTPTISGGMVLVSGGGSGSTETIIIETGDGVPTTRQVIAGTGLSGGGDLTVDRTFTLAFSGTPGDTAAGGTAATGNSAYAARTDHAHGLAAASAVVLGSAAATGSAASVLRSDATIAAFDATDPAGLALNSTAVVGTAAKAARRDHVHAMTAFDATVPGTLVYNSAAATGSATTAARRDHVHGVTASATPGAAASLLTTDATGKLTLVAADLGNAVIRGELRTTILTYGQLMAFNGALIVTPSAGKLLVACTSVDDSSTFAVDIKDSDGLSHAACGALWTAHATTGDVIRMQEATGGGIAALWGRVTAKTDMTTYWRLTVKKLLPATGTNYTFVAGAAVLNYGQANKGNITLSADDDVYLEVATHAGAPQTTQTVRARLGNLNGVGGITSDEYGLWTDNGYFTGTIVAGNSRINTTGVRLKYDSWTGSAYSHDYGSFLDWNIDPVTATTISSTNISAGYYVTGPLTSHKFEINSPAGQLGLVDSYNSDTSIYSSTVVLQSISSAITSYISLQSASSGTQYGIYLSTPGPITLVGTLGTDITGSLDVSGAATVGTTLAIGSASISGSGIFGTTKTYTDPTASNYMAQIYSTVNATATAMTGNQISLDVKTTMSGTGGGSAQSIGGRFASYSGQTSGTITTIASIMSDLRLTAAGAATNGYGFESYIILGSSGSIANAAHYYAAAPSFSSTGGITALHGLRVANQGNAKVTNSYGLYVDAQSGSATSNYAIYTGTGPVHLGDAVDTSAALSVGTTLTVGTSIATGGHSNTFSTEQISVTENGTTAFPLINGIFMISDSQGHHAVCWANGSSAVGILSTSGNYTAVINTSEATNIYVTGSTLTAQNKLAIGTVTYSIFYFTK